MSYTLETVSSTNAFALKKLQIKLQIILLFSLMDLLREVANL